MSARECAVCGVDFDNGEVRDRRPRSRHRCSDCAATVCWDCTFNSLFGRQRQLCYTCAMHENGTEFGKAMLNARRSEPKGGTP